MCSILPVRIEIKFIVGGSLSKSAAHYTPLVDKLGTTLQLDVACAEMMLKYTIMEFSSWTWNRFGLCLCSVVAAEAEMLRMLFLFSVFFFVFFFTSVLSKEQQRAVVMWPTGTLLAALRYALFVLSSFRDELN